MSFERIRSGFQVGLDQFYEHPDNDFTAITDNDVRERKYIELRGLLVPKKTGRGVNGNGYDDARKLLFQFNPAEIRVQKDTQYSYKGYAGLDYGDYVWAGGGEKTISFDLFLDATAGSYTSYFRKTSDTGIRTVSDVRTSRSRGTLDDCELLESFLRPDLPGATGELIVPRFSTGGIVPPDQFKPPPVLIFVYGEFYLECVLKDVSFTHTLFRDDLVPIRSEVSLTLGIFEQRKLRIINNLKNPGASSSPLKRLG